MRLILLMPVVSLMGASVEGVVRSSATAEPIAGARVWMRAVAFAPGIPLNPYYYVGENAVVEGAVTARTDAHGRFLFRDIRPGVYMVEASAEGFNSIELPRAKAWRSDIPFRLTEEQSIHDFEVVLVPESNIVGEVTGLDGQQAKILAEGTSDDGSRWHEDEAAGDRGRFRLGDLWAGAYRVVVVPLYERYPRPEEKEMKGPQPLWAGPLTVAAGETRTWNARLPVGPLRKVKAAVDAPFTPLREFLDCRLVFELGEEWEDDRHRCRLWEGAIEFPWLPDGRYRVELYYQRQPRTACGGTFRDGRFSSTCETEAVDPRETRQHVGWTRFELNGTDREDLRIALRPAAELRFHFAARPDGVPAEKIADPALDPAMRLSLGPSGRWIAPDTFAYTGVAVPGEYSLTIRSKDDSHYLAGVRTECGDVTLTAGGKLVVSNPGTDALTIRLDYRTGAKVMLEDGPNTAAIVFKDPATGAMRAAFSHKLADGRTVIPDVPPGRHRVYLDEDVPCPGFMAASCRGQAAEVVVPEQGQVVIPNRVF